MNNIKSKQKWVRTEVPWVQGKSGSDRHVHDQIKVSKCITKCNFLFDYEKEAAKYFKTTKTLSFQPELNPRVSIEICPISSVTKFLTFEI